MRFKSFIIFVVSYKKSEQFYYILPILCLHIKPNDDKNFCHKLINLHLKTLIISYIIINYFEN